MLKIKDKAGHTIAVLKDEDSSPTPVGHKCCCGEVHENPCTCITHETEALGLYDEELKISKEKEQCSNGKCGTEQNKNS
jgi:hypothetical protein